MVDATPLINAGAVSSIIAAIAAIVSAGVSGYFGLKNAKAQVEITSINYDKDLLLQREKIKSENDDKTISLLLEVLKQGHEAMSRVSSKYSQTQSHIYWTDNISRADFRKIYQEDRENLDRLLSELDIILANYESRDDIHRLIKKIRGQMNMFWGEQEELLRNDEVDGEWRENHRQHRISAIIDASGKISEYADEVQQKIVAIAAYIQNCRHKQHQ